MHTLKTEEDSYQVGSRSVLCLVGAQALVYGFGQFGLGTPPAASETGSEIVAWLAANRVGVKWYVWSVTVGAPLAAFLLAQLRRLLPAPHRDVYLVGAVSILIAQEIQAWTWGGLALHPTTMQPAFARAILDVAVYWGPVLTGATTTTMAPVVWLALRGRAGIPRWLGLLGLVAFLEQAIETITIFGQTGFIQPGGAMNLQLGAGLVTLWMLAFALWGGMRGRFPIHSDTGA